MVDQLPPEPSLEGRRKRLKSPQIINITAAFISLLFTGIGAVKADSPEFNENLKNLEKRITTVIPKKGEGFRHPSEIVDVENLAEKPKSLKITEELNNKEKAKIIENLENFINANFYVDYPQVSSWGEINYYPDTNVLLSAISNLIVELGGKLVPNKESSEIVLKEVRMYVQRFAEKSTPIIKGIIEIKGIKPHVIIELHFEDRQEALQPRLLIVKGYGVIRITDLSRSGSGNFNSREFNQGVEEAINNIGLYLESLKIEKRFLELTESLRKPVFPIETILQDYSSKPPTIYYLIKLTPDDIKSFKADNKINIFAGESLLETIVFKPENAFLDKKTGYLFLKSNKFNDLNVLSEIAKGEKPIFAVKQNDDSN